MTRIKEQEKKIELHRLKNVAESFLWLNLGMIILFVISLKIIGEFIPLKYWAILFFIAPYYANILRIHGIKGNTIKYIFFNILSISAVYSILLTFNNLIFNMIELSSNYLISNIAYFYISFLIVTFNYKFYDKCLFAADIWFGLVLKAKSNPIYIVVLTFFSSFIIMSIIICIMSTMNLANNILLKTVIIMSLIVILSMWAAMIYYVISFNYENKTHENYKTLKNWLLGFESIIKNFTIWFIEIFKIESIDTGHIINSKGKINRINAIVLLTSKFIPIIILLFLMATNSYYASYSYKNNGSCEVLTDEISRKKTDILKDNSKIIDLKNNDILFIYEKFKVKQDICKRKLIEFELKTALIK